MNKKVSIIVPIYNAQVYLAKNIKSIVNQDYRNLEIILVNDCSTDGSFDICQKFAKQDSRIKLVDKKINEGEDFARFTGIEHATGEYLVFLDADDWFISNAISFLVKTIEDKDVDIVYASNIRVYSTRLNIKEHRYLSPQYCDRVIKGEEKDELYISYFGVNIVPVTMWGNIYKKDLFNLSLERSKLKFGADLALSMQLYRRAKSFYMSQTPVLYYRWGGITAVFQPNLLESCKKLYSIKMANAEALNFEKAKLTATIELCNCLASYILQLATYYSRRPQQNIADLEKEFANTVYQNFTSICDHAYVKADGLRLACAQRNAEAAYNIACAMVRKPKNRLRIVVKKLCSSILKFIPI